MAVGGTCLFESLESYEDGEAETPWYPNGEKLVLKFDKFHVNEKVCVFNTGSLLWILLRTFCIE